MAIKTQQQTEFIDLIAKLTIQIKNNNNKNKNILICNIFQ